MVSVAGGWFFLMACEMFVLGKRDFRLPGLGSYLQSAASAGDTVAIIWGISAMIGVVVLIDQLVWRPAIAWSDKFKLEQVESSAAHSSLVLNLLRKSPLLTRMREGITTPVAGAYVFVRCTAARRIEVGDVQLAKSAWCSRRNPRGTGNSIWRIPRTVWCSKQSRELNL